MSKHGHLFNALQCQAWPGRGSRNNLFGVLRGHLSGASLLEWIPENPGGNMFKQRPAIATRDHDGMLGFSSMQQVTDTHAWTASSDTGCRAFLCWNPVGAKME
jgi:hypothetical protein